MRKRLLLANVGLLIGSAIAAAQPPMNSPPPPLFPTGPYSPQPPLFPGTIPSTPLPGSIPGSGSSLPGGPGAPRLPDPIPPSPISPANPTQPIPFPPQSRPGLPPAGQSSPVLTGHVAPGMTNPYPGLANHLSNTQPGQQPIAKGLEIPLPQPENKIAVRSVDVTLKRVQGAWQLWCGQRMLRDFGEREMEARDAFNVYRDSHLTEWVTIGGAKPIVEYGLANGRAPGAPIPVGGHDSGTLMNPGPLPQGAMNFAGTGGSTNAPGMSTPAKFALPIDLKSVRVEAVRGVWCLRDDFNILLNFGPVKVDADQALAAVQHYGFNRLGMVGYPAPLMTYFYVGQDDGRQFDRGPFGKAALQAQIDGLARVGIPVPGVGYVGEMVRFDPRKLDVRKEKGEWIVAGGTEVLGRYGQSEWGARDAARTLGDMRVTEFCKLGSAGMTFFLADGKAPTNVPFAVQGRRFNPNALRVLQYGNRCMVSENGRSLFDCANPQEGEVLIKVVKHFGFDQICRLGATGTAGVTFLAKGQ